jgi:ribosome-associated protein
MPHPVPDPAAADQPEPLRLDHYLKLVGAADTGGQAKLFIQGGEVKLNGVVETRRRKKLAVGDVIEIAGQRFTVTDTAS